MYHHHLPFYLALSISSSHALGIYNSLTYFSPSTTITLPPTTTQVINTAATILPSGMETGAAGTSAPTLPSAPLYTAAPIAAEPPSAAPVLPPESATNVPPQPGTSPYYSITSYPPISTPMGNPPAADYITEIEVPSSSGVTNGVPVIPRGSQETAPSAPPQPENTGTAGIISPSPEDAREAARSSQQALAESTRSGFMTLPSPPPPGGSGVWSQTWTQSWSASVAPSIGSVTGGPTPYPLGGVAR